MTSTRQSCELIDMAETCVANSKDDEAKELIYKAVSICPKSQKIYGDAVNLLLEVDLYTDAKKLFRRYKKETGKELVSDFSLNEIIQMEEDNSPTATDDSVKFVRMTLKERGHFSNIFTFWPVKKIEIFSKSFSITQGKKKYTFDWGEVLDARVIIKNSYKSYGGGTAAKFIQKTFFIDMPERSFKFDVSSSFPDFNNNKQLFKEFSSRLNVHEIDTRKQ